MCREGFDFAVFLRTCPVVLDMAETSLDGVVEQLIAALVAEGCLDPGLRGAVCSAVLAREVSGGSTALVDGIGVPHGCVDDLKGMVAAFGIHRTGVDCSAADGQPTRIFILVVGPTGCRGRLAFLAAVNRRLLQPEVRLGLLAARSREEVLSLLSPSAESGK